MKHEIVILSHKRGEPPLAIRLVHKDPNNPEKTTAEYVEYPELMDKDVAVGQRIEFESRSDGSFNYVHIDKDNKPETRLKNLKQCIDASHNTMLIEKDFKVRDFNGVIKLDMAIDSLIFNSSVRSSHTPSSIESEYKNGCQMLAKDVINKLNDIKQNSSGNLTESDINSTFEKLDAMINNGGALLEQKRMAKESYEKSKQFQNVEYERNVARGTVKDLKRIRDSGRQERSSGDEEIMTM